MMREIKFRAWDKIQNVMFNFDIYNVPSYVGQTHLEGEKFERNYDIMQYTGLKDKNGVEIYEGDVVEYTDHWSGQSYINEIYWKFGSLVFDVEFEEDKRYTVPIHSIHMDDDRGYEQTLKVLGNIYENPEILGGSQ